MVLLCSDTKVYYSCLGCKSSSYWPRATLASTLPEQGSKYTLGVGMHMPSYSIVRDLMPCIPYDVCRYVCHLMQTELIPVSFIPAKANDKVCTLEWMLVLYTLYIMPSLKLQNWADLSYILQI